MSNEKQHIASKFVEEGSDWGWKYAFTTDVKISDEKYEEILEAINRIINNKNEQGRKESNRERF